MITLIITTYAAGTGEGELLLLESKINSPKVSKSGKILLFASIAGNLELEHQSFPHKDRKSGPLDKQDLPNPDLSRSFARCRESIMLNRYTTMEIA